MNPILPRGVDSGRQLCMLATDMDSTLLNDNHQLTDTNKAALHLLHGRGIHILLCSGRMSPCMFPYEHQLGIDMNMVCYNGALALTQRASGRVAVYDHPVPASSTTRILDWVEKHGYTANVYPRNELSRGMPAPPDAIGIAAVRHNESHHSLTHRYHLLTNCKYTWVDNYSQFKDTTPYKILVLSDENIDELHTKIVSDLVGIKDELHIIKADYFIEFVNKRANKRAALTHLCSTIGVDMAEVVAFGDGLNDIEFMEGTGLAIAVANAKPLCAAAAARVSSKTNHEDAVAFEVDALLAAGRFATKVEAAQPQPASASDSKA